MMVRAEFRNGGLSGGDTPSPFFSVIILNWNGKHLLEECLDSVLGQTFRDFDVIVVDNGSRDGSADFLREAYGDRIRLVPLDENLLGREQPGPGGRRWRLDRVPQQ